ncbi:hypothetical protein BDV95DRAFT_136833 [Massariosphaeria phaeospora]|uniref:Uncharacterized protein n=1 Tax=Massariosphaeria phaeospora TaxID=100035 RepID=A0A7C8MI93_9PLEO|nr:hypothetical protein BDV95DRAFT_136833 [Massariosphaeria phaeospora]
MQAIYVTIRDEPEDDTVPLPTYTLASPPELLPLYHPTKFYAGPIAVSIVIFIALLTAVGLLHNRKRKPIFLDDRASLPDPVVAYSPGPTDMVSRHSKTPPRSAPPASPDRVIVSAHRLPTSSSNYSQPFGGGAMPAAGYEQNHFSKRFDFDRSQESFHLRPTRHASPDSLRVHSDRQQQQHSPEPLYTRPDRYPSPQPLHTRPTHYNSRGSSPVPSMQSGYQESLDSPSPGPRFESEELAARVPVERPFSESTNNFIFGEMPEEARHLPIRDSLLGSFVPESPAPAHIPGDPE